MNGLVLLLLRNRCWCYSTGCGRCSANCIESCVEDVQGTKLSATEVYCSSPELS